MSDDERSDDTSDSDDLETTGLIATRQKRATAGNLYATLRANLDDEELQKELLAEDEEGDAGDYEGSDKDADDDDVLQSSSDEEDAGPPKEGEQEDLDGEAALKRQERVEARKKRKLHDARLKLPAWNKKKRVKLAEDVKTEDGSMSERPRKKSERSNWLPTAADLPVRQSGRSHAVANREIIHANLKQSAERSERQRRVMKNAAVRDNGKKRMTELSQEDRLKKCEKIERETAKEFGRWEREEAERQRQREEALAAKRKKGLEGAFFRSWSGSVLWEGDKIKIRRMSHGSKNIEDIQEDSVEADAAGLSAEAPVSKEDVTATPKDAAPAQDAKIDGKADSQNDAVAVPLIENEGPTASATSSMPLQEPPPPPSSEKSWLDGIQQYAEQPHAPTTTTGYTPSATAIHVPQTIQPQQPPMPISAHPPSQPLPEMYHGWPPGSHQFTVHPQPQAVPPPPAAPPPPPAPLVREQAQRILLMLENFASLEALASTAPKRVPKYKLTETLLDSDPVKATLLPTAFPITPPLTPDESKYILARPRKRAGNEVPLPSQPSRRRCALTSWPAKFRDPKTGLAYADMHQYKAIQRILAGGCTWSGLLGCWAGSSYGTMGRPAKGVPDGFADSSMAAKKESS